METGTVDETDRAVLAAIGDGRVTEEAIEERVASRLDPPPDDLADRLRRLGENALLERAGDGRYELTENGVRLLNATGRGDRDDRIDTPADVAAAIESLELPPAETDAVRTSFSFLRYWGDATTAEVIDAAYSEVPAGYDDADRWWADCVGDSLAVLPRVEGSPDSGPAARWTYDGTAVVEGSADSDGRAVMEDIDGPSRFGSVRRGIEVAARTDEERRAVRAAFAALFDRGSATSRELVEAANDLETQETTHLETEELLEEFLEVLPDVERDQESGAADEVVWTYEPGRGVEGST